jgi:type I restriction enzyme R subunit
MTGSESEADARILIDGLLRKAGLDPADKFHVRTEVTARRLPDELRERPTGATAEEVSRADYALLSSRGRNLSIVEAKRKAIDPYTAKHQALPTAKALDAEFIFLSNGELIYFWDYLNEDAWLVQSFFSQSDLERLAQRRRSCKPLATIPIPETYLRQDEVAPCGATNPSVCAPGNALELGKSSPTSANPFLRPLPDHPQ